MCIRVYVILHRRLFIFYFLLFFMFSSNFQIHFFSNSGNIAPRLSIEQRAVGATITMPSGCTHTQYYPTSVHLSVTRSVRNTEPLPHGGSHVLVPYTPWRGVLLFVFVCNNRLELLQGTVVRTPKKKAESHSDLSPMSADWCLQKNLGLDQALGRPGRSQESMRKCMQ